MSQLIVPIRDRRQHRRIVTLKNFGRLAIALAIVLAGLTIASEMQRGTPSDGYGRLFRKEVASHNDVARQKFDIVKEAPVADQTAADPMLIRPAARAQALGIGLDPAKPAGALPADDLPVAHERMGPGVSIVGDSAGVAVVHQNGTTRGSLSGGIFKKQ